MNLTTAFADCSRWFSRRYSDSRYLFLNTIEKLTESEIFAHTYNVHIHPMEGPDGGQLATDVLWLGPDTAKNVIVLISATHGVEGYTGSAIQSYLLDSLETKALQLPPNTALLYVHALNAWGMAWHRRCDEQGIDLNRNFVDFSQPRPEHPFYQKAKVCLVEPDASLRQEAFVRLSQELDSRTFEEAISSGQYSDEDAPFYGGTQASSSRKCIESVMEQFRLASRNIIVLDLHTGLGPWGYGELISDHPPGCPQETFAKELFGEAIAVPADGTSSSVPKYGLQDYAWHKIMNDRSCYLTLEYGTFSTHTLFETLIEDHIAWAPIARIRSGDTTYISAHKDSADKMLHHFSPADAYWQQAVLFKATQVVNRIFEYIAVSK